MMKKRFLSKYRISTLDPENVTLHSSRSFRYGDVLCCGSCSIEDRISYGLQSYVFGSLPRPPEFCFSLPLRCNYGGLVCQFLKSLSKNESRNISDDDCVAIWRFCVFRETMILLEDVQQTLEYRIDDRFRFFVELFTLWCGIAYTVSEDIFRHHVHFKQRESYKFFVVTCWLYFCGNDCHGFLKLGLLVNEFYVKRLMNYEGLQVMTPPGVNSLTNFHASIIVVIVQPLNLFFKQEACYLEMLISFVESFIPILSGSGLSPDHSLRNSPADSPAVSTSPADSPAVSKSPADSPAASNFSGSNFLKPAISSFLSLVYREFDSTVKIVIKLRNDESDVISSYDESSSIVINRFHMSASLFGFICDRFLRQRSMMILLAVSHFVSYLIQPDRSDFLGCSAEYDNGSISVDKYPSVSGFVEFKTPPDLLLVEDRMLIKASWFSTVIVLGFQEFQLTTLFDGFHVHYHCYYGLSLKERCALSTCVPRHRELTIIILGWLIQRYQLLLIQSSSLQVRGCVLALYKEEVKDAAVNLYGKSKVTAMFLTTKDLSLLLHGDVSFVIQEHVDTSSLSSTFIFGSLTRPPELHCASLWFSSSLLRFTRMFLSLRS